MFAKDERDGFALGDAIRDLGWFPLLFVAIIGGPSVLAILDEVLVNHHLVPALQWIIDGYNGSAAVLGSIAEPLILPVVDWLNGTLDWSLSLDPVWRPVFALCMLFAVAAARSSLFESYLTGFIINIVVWGFSSLTAALSVGLLAAGNTWQAQGAVPVVPVAIFAWLSLL